MLSLSLKSKNKPPKIYTFEDTQIIHIGRKSDNDIVLQDKSVSGYHARIEPKSNAYLLMDLRSKNGTFVNESFVNSYWMDEDDVITIGNSTVVSHGRSGGRDSFSLWRSEPFFLILNLRK